MGTPLLPALPGYENPELIAHGTTALVFRAVQTTLNRPVAIKVITTDTGDVPVNTERELATTVALSSQPHIVSIIDTGVTSDDRPYIVMEYCEGGSYAQILRREGPLPVDDVVEVGVSIGEALHAAHQAGIVHRDVKPSNILRSRFGPALTDFGIARAPDELSGTLTREMMTPHHASPEALLHQAQSGSSDVYSLASTMWTLLVGHPPFVDPNNPDTDMYSFRDRVLNDPLPTMPRTDVPEWLVQELTRAMAKRPSDRHATAREFADALRRATLGVPVATTATEPRPETPERESAGGDGPIFQRGVVARARVPSPAPTGGTGSMVDATAQIQDPEGQGGWLGAEAVAVAPRPRSPTETPAPAAERGRRDDEARPDEPRHDEPRHDVRHDAARPNVRDDAARPDEPRHHDVARPEAVPASRAISETHRLGEEDLRRDLTPRGRGTVIGVLAVLALVAVAAAAVLMLNAEGPASPPQSQPTTMPVTTTVIGVQASGAPTSVRIEDDAGTAVTLSWTDPTGGAVAFVVIGKRADETPLDPVSLPQGTTMATVDGLDPGNDYCFTVGAVYSVTRVAAAPAVCTTR